MISDILIVNIYEDFFLNNILMVLNEFKEGVPINVLRKQAWRCENIFCYISGKNKKQSHTKIFLGNKVVRTS